MKTIEVEDMDYYQLLGRATEAGISIQALITDLLGKTGGQGTGHAQKPSIPAAPTEPSVVDGWIREGEFLRQTTALGRFMYLLERLYRESPGDFDRVTALSGRKRRYIGRSEGDLNSYGTSVYPKRIANSPYWVVTNLENARKRQIVEGVMRMLGYTGADIRIATSAI